MKLLILLVLVGSVQWGISSEEGPAKLNTLRSSWESAKNDALKPLNQKYLEALIRLKSEYTKAGRLQDALAVDAEIAALQEQDRSMESSLKDQIVHRLVSSDCKWFDGSIIIFNKDGSIMSPHSDWLGPFEVKNNGDIIIKHRSINGR